MSILTLREAYEKGMLKEGTQIAMPVDGKRKTEVPEFLSGVKGGCTVEYDSEEFEGRVLDRCLCTIIGKRYNGYIKAVGEIMPNYVELRGAIGLTRARACLDYVTDSQFGYPKLGIAVEHITPSECREHGKKYLLPCPEFEWDDIHWLSSRFVYPYSSSSCSFGLQRVSSYGVGSYNLYYYSSGSALSNSYSYAVRPVYNLPIYLSDITILADEKHDGKSEETAYIIQGPGMPKIA